MFILFERFISIQTKSFTFKTIQQPQQHNDWSVEAPPFTFSPALGSRTSSTASRMLAGSSCHSDESAAQLGLRETSCHRRPPSQATASRPGPHLLSPPPPDGRSSRRMRSRRRCRSAGPSLPGRRPGPGPDLLLPLWVEVCSVDTEDTGSTPVVGWGWGHHLSLRLMGAVVAHLHSVSHLSLNQVRAGDVITHLFIDDSVQPLQTRLAEGVATVQSPRQPCSQVVASETHNTHQVLSLQ